MNQKMGDPAFEELEGLYLTFSNQKTGQGLKCELIFVYERLCNVKNVMRLHSLVPKNECVMGKTGKSNKNGFKQQQYVAV